MSIINQVIAQLEERHNNGPLAQSIAPTPRANPAKSVCFFIGALAGLLPILLLVYAQTQPSHPNLPPISTHRTITPDLRAHAANPSPTRTQRVEYRVGSGDSLSTIFAHLKISAKQLHYLLQTPASSQYLTHLQPGQKLHFQLSADHTLQRLRLDKTRQQAAIVFQRLATTNQFMAEYLAPHTPPTHVPTPAIPTATAVVAVVAVVAPIAPDPSAVATDTLAEVKRVADTPQPQQYYARAQTALQRQDPTGALTALTQALLIKPDYAAARLLAGSLLIEQKKYSRALTLLQTGLTQQPDNAHILQMLSQAQIALGLYPEAIHALQRYLTQQDNTALRATLAALYQKTQQHHLAIQTYQQVLKHEQKPVWWMGLGISYEANQQPEQAIEAYETALKLGGLAQQTLHFTQVRLQQLTRAG